MFVERTAITFKQGCIKQVISFLTAEGKRPAIEGKVMTPVFAPYNRAMLELRFASFEERDKYWADWYQTKTPPLVMSCGQREFWEIQQPLDDLPDGKYINWLTAKVHPNLHQPFIELLVAERSKIKRFEILTALVGPTNRIALQFVFDTIPGYLREWEVWSSRDTSRRFFEQWAALSEPVFSNELWVIKYNFVRPEWWLENEMAVKAAEYPPGG